MEEWTLATPIIDRDKEIDIYLESLKKISLPREQIHLLWVDQSNNKKIHKKLKFYLNEYGHLYKSCTLEKVDFETFYCTKGDPVNRRVAIAKVMDYINSKRKGHLLLWEDDIYAPEDAFNSCYKLFNSLDNVGAVTTCQYQRRQGCENQLMVWNWAEVPVFGSNDTSKEKKVCPIAVKQELDFGFSVVGATANGFVLIKEEVLNGYVFDGITDGPDVMLGYHISKTFKKYLVLNWECKTVHLGRDSDNNIKLFKSELCKTEVPGHE